MHSCVALRHPHADADSAPTDILLTTPIYTALLPTSPAPTPADLPAPPAPLIKLTDFGLSRFVDIRSQEERRRDRRARRAAGQGGADADANPENDDEDEDDDDEGPLLSTRCGSEAYAAPELVMGGSAARRSEPSPPRACASRAGAGAKAEHGRERERERKGVYDARETDAWACGVVLYALVGRRLPFGEGAGAGAGAGGGIARDGEGASHAHAHARGRMARRAWLMRIARGEYEWPEVEAESDVGEGGGGELVGPALARSEGARRVVGRLLVRDPRRRARIADLWGDVWMGGSGEVKLELGLGDVEKEEGEDKEEEEEEEQEEQEEEEEEEEEEEMGEEELEEALREAEAEVETDGWLVDQEGIGDVARREVV
ncbi:hypothetical protein C0993_001966 [Termitomyces sp. T159_Od127]|nr:hypothetical protein C0993_001966 [Termitomyces sp. T159_Od127]